MAEVTPMAPKNGKSQAPPPPSPPPKEKNKGGRPKAGTPPQDPGPAFWKKVADVPAADWEGDLACMYVYVTEPILNLKIMGKKVHLVKLQKPICDLQPLMEAYGSFQGYITLNRRKIEEALGPQLARYDFEIYNPNYPPKFPKSAWMNDPRNEKWAALLPPEPPPPSAASAAGNPLEMLKTLDEIVDRRVERMEAAQPIPPEPLDPAQQLKDVAGVFSSLLAAGQGKQEGSTAILELMKLQMTMMQSQLESERRRAEHLETEIRKVLSAPPAKQDGLLEQLQAKLITDFIEDKRNPSQQEQYRSRMGPWQEFFQPVVAALPNSPVLTNLSQGIMYWMMSKAQQALQENAAKHGQPAPQTAPFTPPAPALPSLPQPQPAQQPAAIPQPQPQQPQPQSPQGAQPAMPILNMKLRPEQLVPFVGDIMQPLMVHIQNPEKDGWDLAQWVIDGRGMQDYLFIKNQGADTIMQAFRLSQFWPQLVGIEPQLQEFIEQFCSWPPPDEDEAADSGEVRIGAISLDGDDEEDTE